MTSGVRTLNRVTQPFEMQRSLIESLSEYTVCCQEAMKGKDEPDWEGFPTFRSPHTTNKLIFSLFSVLCSPRGEIKKGLDLLEARSIIQKNLLGRFRMPR